MLVGAISVPAVPVAVVPMVCLVATGVSLKSNVLLSLTLNHVFRYMLLFMSGGRVNDKMSNSP